MIIVVEGISASGKSTWCARHSAGNFIPETSSLKTVAKDIATQAEEAKFWVDLNAARWRAALDLEECSNSVICDTDPLKLHYTWGLWQIGEGSEEQWVCQLAETREAFLNKRIGFADAYIIGEVNPEVARLQRNADLVRRRRNFEVHVRLQPSLITWYRTLSSVLPCSFFFGFPTALPAPLSAWPRARYDVALFDKVIESLPHPAQPQAT